jgi:hypothetical protein
MLIRDQSTYTITHSLSIWYNSFKYLNWIYLTNCSFIQGFGTCFVRHKIGHVRKFWILCGTKLSTCANFFFCAAQNWARARNITVSQSPGFISIKCPQSIISRKFEKIACNWERMRKNRVCGLVLYWHLVYIWYTCKNIFHLLNYVEVVPWVVQRIKILWRNSKTVGRIKFAKNIYVVLLVLVFLLISIKIILLFSTWNSIAFYINFSKQFSLEFFSN